MGVKKMKFEELINVHFDHFTANDEYICTCIVQHREDCIHLGIEEFSKKYHVSTSALSRFAQKLQLPGYSELKALLRFEGKAVNRKEYDMKDVLDTYHHVIDHVEQKDCRLLFEKLYNAKRIIVYGEGYQQGRAAKEMKRIFLPTGKSFYDMYGVDTIPSLQKFVQEGDVVFFISLHGEQKEVISFAKQLKLKGAFLISITKMKSNELSHLCDESFYIDTMQMEIDDTLHYEVTTPYFILIELLYVKYKLYCDVNIFSNNENKN